MIIVGGRHATLLMSCRPQWGEWAWMPESLPDALRVVGAAGHRLLSCGAQFCPWYIWPSPPC